MLKTSMKFIFIPLLFGFFRGPIARGQQSVSFQDGINGYSGTRDTKLLSNSPDTNYGTATSLELDGDPDDESTLLSWDLTNIPSGSTINSVEITVDVTNTASNAYELYEMKRAWVEYEATWNIYASGLSWQNPGANGSGDRGSTVLGSISPPSTGLYTISLNADGVAMVQSWVDNPSANHGFIIMNYDNTNGATFYSREETVANPPKITVTYTPPPGLTLISPNGGEIWEVGSTQDITWNSSGTTSGTVKIEYSIDNGLHWNDIITSTEDDGTQPWTIPSTSTSQALVRISDTDMTGPSDSSDAVFTITSVPTLIVTSPNGGEDWEGGNIENITWSSLGTSGTVKIEFSADNGLSWSDIALSAPDTGSYLWTVPDTSTTDALVHISDIDGDGPSDISDAVFTITSPPQEEAIIFSATGDIPNGSSDIAILQQQIADHNLYSPSEFFVHLGDIKEQTTDCPESYYSLAADMLRELAVPVFIVPGDNGTTDCSNEGEAWAYWVQYFMDFELNFCGAPLAEKQASRPENFAFVSKGVLFIGINLTSSSDSIMADDAAWIEEQFTDNVWQVRGAVIFSHRGPSSSLSLFFNRFVAAAQTFAKPILFLHGHGHSWIEDHYWPSAPNVLRIQVDNGGAEEPLQVTVTTDAQNMFVYLRDPFSKNPQVYNVMPCVEAGPDQQINSTSTANLQGRATDDGVPTSPATLTATWSKISGPGSVTFGDPHNDTTSASFSLAGNYLLRLTADDGVLQNYDELMVEVIGSSVQVEAKIFLEGPYDASADTMRTGLGDNDFIPFTSPYAEDPRSVSVIPNKVVDWVLVQLRQTATGAAVASRSAFLRDDGKIVGDDGITPTVTMDAGPDNYYIVIKHRNHLAVMSADSIQLSSGPSILYDFSTGMAQYYGSDAKELEAGIYGMYTGDANFNGQVQNDDKNDYWKLQVGSGGYRNADFNLNGQVQNDDKNDFWKQNVGKGTRVP